MALDSGGNVRKKPPDKDDSIMGHDETITYEVLPMEGTILLDIHSVTKLNKSQENPTPNEETRNLTPTITRPAQIYPNNHLGPYIVLVEAKDANRNLGNLHPMALGKLFHEKKIEGIKSISRKGKNRIQKGLIVGVYYNPETKEHKFTPAGQTINNRTGGKLDELLKGGKPLSQGRSSVFQYLDENFHHVVVVGLGREDACYNQVENLDEFRENIRVAAANGITRLQSKGVTEAFVESLGNAEAAAEGSVLTVYEYQELKSKETRRNIPRVHLYQNDDIAGWKRGVIKAEAQNLARRLCETPANLMTPAIFAQNAVEALCPCGVSVEVRDRDWAESKRMTAFMAVAKGSCEPPVILELGYCGGNQEQKPITFVGKGSTFDAGGLCLRKFLGMEEFRADMAGAAVVVSVMRAAASLSLPLNLQAVIPLCENMPSGMALKPGDVVQGMNGKSIRIDATDNEGRLMLADALNYAYHTFKPYILMDIGTLTEGTLHALADAATAVYTNSEEIWKGMSQAGAITGDRVWRMPLWKHFTGKIANIGSADMTNKGNGPGGGACRAAAFMKEMVPCGHWMHLDISNTGMKAHNADFPYLRVGRMTGRPTRTLIQFLYQLSCADFKDKPPVK